MPYDRDPKIKAEFHEKFFCGDLAAVVRRSARRRLGRRLSMASRKTPQHGRDQATEEALCCLKKALKWDQVDVVKKTVNKSFFRRSAFINTPAL